MFLHQIKGKLVELFMEVILEKLEIIYKFLTNYLFLIIQKMTIELVTLRLN